MNCLTYARVSTQEQAERELSLPAQQQAMRDYATKQGWFVAGEFVERGVSAKTTQRPELQRLLARCKAEPRVDVVLVHKVDRLARNMADHVALRAFLKQRGIRLASVVENVDDSVTGQLVENIMASIAQFYNENLASEVKKGMQQLVRNGGWPHRPPRGYKIARDEGGRPCIVFDEAVAPAFRAMFEAYATGTKSVLDVRDQLTEAGIRAGNGRPLNAEYVRQQLKNPFYAGRVRWKELDYPGKHPALVSPAMFQRVQDVLELRNREYDGKARLHFWLRGILRCEACGRRMTAERHGRWTYYRCVANNAKSGLCSSPPVPGHVAEPPVLSLLRRLRIPEPLKRRLRESIEAQARAASQDSKSQLESLRVRKAKLEIQENRLTAAFAEGTVSAPSYRTTVDRVRGELAHVESALEKTGRDPQWMVKRLEAAFNLADSLLGVHTTLQPTSQTALLRVVFKRIVVNRSGLSGYELNSPFDALLSEMRDDQGDSSQVDAPDLLVNRITPTKEEIPEFDEIALQNLAGLLLQIHNPASGGLNR